MMQQPIPLLLLNLKLRALMTTTIYNLLKEARLHVQQADAQRDHCNLKIKEAEADHAANKPHEMCQHCIVIDYSQSIGIP